MENNDIKQKEIKRVINQLLTLDGVKFSTMDNMDEYEFSLTFSTTDNGKQVVSVLPNAKTVQIQNTTSDLVVILNSTAGSDEYNQAINRLQVNYEKNGYTGFVIDKKEINNLLQYKAQIEEIGKMTPQEIVENYDEYLRALTIINNVI